MSTITISPAGKMTPQEVKELREASGLSIKEAAAEFGYAEQTWRNKESATGALTIAEVTLLHLLAGSHPTYTLKSKG